MLRLRAPLTAAVLLAATARPALAQRTDATATAVNIPFEQMTLPNGLRVILAPDRTVPQVAVNVWYHVGSKDETPGRTGFAHLFEHVMFTGSGHVPYGLHDRLTEGVGGSNNGSTTNDRTNYYEVVPSNYMESALWLEADRMGFLLDKLDQEKFVAQRDIVQNERRQGVDNQPYGRAFELLDYAIYPATHPYSWPVVGYMTDLQAATVDDVKAFFRKHYAPSNASLAIVGDFDPARAKQLVTKYFGDLPKGATTIERPRLTAPVLDAEKRITFEDRVQVPRLYLAWPSVGDESDDVFALDALGVILSNSRTSRLQKALVYDSQQAASVSAFNDGNEKGGRFIVQLTPRPGHTLAALEASADAVLARVRSEGITEAELTKAKAQLEFAYVSQLQSNLGKADILNSGLIFKGDPGAFKSDYARLLALTTGDITRVAEKYLSGNRAVLSMVPLGKPELASKADASRLVTVAADGAHYVMGDAR